MARRKRFTRSMLAIDIRDRDGGLINTWTSLHASLDDALITVEIALDDLTHWSEFDGGAFAEITIDPVNRRGFIKWRKKRLYSATRIL